METLKAIYSDKLKVDNREPLAVFAIPGFDGDFGIFAPRVDFWTQLILLVLLQVGIQVAFALIIYYSIIKKRGSMSAYLIGFGFIMPISLLIPFKILDILDVQNYVIRLSLVSLATIIFFRTIEAMFGTSPHTVESSAGTYAAYYTCLMHFEWDPKTKTRRKITPKELASNFATIVFLFHAMSLMLSFEMHFDFKPFPSSVELAEFKLDASLFTPTHIGNTYLLGILTYLMLHIGFDLTAFSENVKGFYTKPSFDHPLFTSRSPSEFWGRKWNMMIHRFLKHGIYLPARQFLPNWASIGMAFLFSGLLHEYTWLVLFYHHESQKDDAGICMSCFTPIPLKLTAFFLWNGAVMLLERPLSPLFSFTKSLPRIVVSFLVLLTALPVSHWYSGDWAMGGKYADFAIGLWHIRKL